MRAVTGEIPLAARPVRRPHRPAARCSSTSATDEVLLDDATRLAANAEKAGVAVTLEVWPEMTHVWHGSAGYVPEADDAIARIVEFSRPLVGLA